MGILINLDFWAGVGFMACLTGIAIALLVLTLKLKKWKDGKWDE